MENVADALKIAAAVLIFVVAIASSFSLFGTAKQTADSIVGMRDRQAYLEATELDSILYISSDKISESSGDNISSIITGLTTKGDRIVGVDDVISTIYRYNKEKYGVTIVNTTGAVIARFDSNTENVMRQYNNIESGLDEYKEKLEKNTTTTYVRPKFTGTKLEDLYKIDVRGNSEIRYGAPWYGDDIEIQKRINVDVSGGTYSYNGQIYRGKSLLSKLEGASKIVEVTNEIDQSKYLEDSGNTTNLLQQYQMPTVEIIYIIYN